MWWPGWRGSIHKSMRLKQSPLKLPLVILFLNRVIKRPKVISALQSYFQLKDEKLFVPPRQQVCAALCSVIREEVHLPWRSWFKDCGVEKHGGGSQLTDVEAHFAFHTSWCLARWLSLIVKLAGWGDNEALDWYFLFLLVCWVVCT